jgi:hypothetical protein
MYWRSSGPTASSRYGEVTQDRVLALNDIEQHQQHDSGGNGDDNGSHIVILNADFRSNG